MSWMTSSGAGAGAGAVVDGPGTAGTAEGTGSAPDMAALLLRSEDLGEVVASDWSGCSAAATTSPRSSDRSRRAAMSGAEPVPSAVPSAVPGPSTAAPAPAPAPDDVIHDIGFRHYDGQRFGRGWVVRSLLVETVRGVFGLGRPARAKVMPWALIGILLVPPLIIALSILLTGGDQLPVSYTQYPSSM